MLQKKQPTKTFFSKIILIKVYKLKIEYISRDNDVGIFYEWFKIVMSARVAHTLEFVFLPIYLQIDGYLCS